MIRVALLVAGPKGLGLLEALSDAPNSDHEIAFVSSYPSRGIVSDPLSAIEAVCDARAYRFLERSMLSAEHYRSVDLVFAAGWQFFVEDVEKLIVFHDSLLPRYRGFSPTVSALIDGATEIGVTAFQPTERIDAGGVYALSRESIRYPIKIKTAYEILKSLYGKVALEVIASYASGSLEPKPQDETQATYSLWRDDDDYDIDWEWDSSKIVRFIDALGEPYLGAKTSMDGRRITINEAAAVEDLHLVNRVPGKIWRIQEGRPEVVCGRGLLRILDARDETGGAVTFSKLRLRLGKPR